MSRHFSCFIMGFCLATAFHCVTEGRIEWAVANFICVALNYAAFRYVHATNKWAEGQTP